MNGVFIVPTGIEAEIGGHAGDATPAAKMVASVCDKLILHPNVVNASDVNEMANNSLYVEGSMLDRFLEGEIDLKECRTSNTVLVVVNPPVEGESINAVSSGRVTIGLDAEILELKTPLQMIATLEDGVASGNVLGWKELVEQVKEYGTKYNFDVLAIHTPIDVSKERAIHYFKNGGVNPWGGVEAKTTRLISAALGKPAAHAPIHMQDPDPELDTIYQEVVDPRIAPEVISICYLHCVLKGLHRAPTMTEPGKGFSIDDIDFMVSPYGCWGRPHKACTEKKIPVIVVKENKTCLNDEIPKSAIVVENYWEAMGVITAMKAGVDWTSVRRPLIETQVTCDEALPENKPLDKASKRKSEDVKPI